MRILVFATLILGSIGLPTSSLVHAQPVVLLHDGYSIPEDKAENLALGATIIASFKDATGGTAYDNLKTYHQVTIMTTQTPKGAMEVTVDQTVQLPDHMYLVTTFPFGTQTQVITKEEGWSEALGRFHELTDAEVVEAQAKIQEDILSILRRADDLEFQVINITEIGGKQCLQVEVCFDSGKTIMFIDQATNLLVMVQRPRKSPYTGEPVSQRTYISEYHEMDGFKIPRIMKVTLDDEDFAVIEVTAFEANINVDSTLFMR